MTYCRVGTAHHHACRLGVAHHNSNDSALRDGIVLSVIAPCYNERDNVDLLVNRTLAVFDTMKIATELVLVDDGSTDGTWERVRRRCRDDVRVHGVRHAANEGIESAWHTGLNAAAGELVCLIDADLQNRPEDIPRLYKTYLCELPDVVQGVRHAVQGVRRYRMFSRALNLLLNAAFRMHLKDNKSGFILCRRNVLASILRHRYSYRYFQSFVGVAAEKRGYCIAEVDTDFDDRHAGRSFLGRFPIGVSLTIFWELLKFRVEIWTASTAETTARRPCRSTPPVSATYFAQQRVGDRLSTIAQSVHPPPSLLERGAPAQSEL